MEETVSQQQSTNSGVASGSLSAVLRLKDLPHYKLGQTEDDPFHATNEKWVEFATCIYNLTGTDVGFWTWEMRRDLLNLALEAGFVRIEGDRLIPIEEVYTDGTEQVHREIGEDTRTPVEGTGELEPIQQ